MTKKYSDKIKGLEKTKKSLLSQITKHKRIEEKLARIAAEQKNIMATISDGIYMLDMSGNLINWNKAAEVVSGLSAEELMDKPVVELFAKEDRAAVAEAVTKGLEEGIGEVTGSFLRKDRSPAIYQWSTVPLKDPQGKVIGLTGVGRDITERTQIEEELARIAAEQKNIMATISDGIYMLDMSGNLINWNKAAEVVTGLSAEELTGKPIVELFAKEDRASVAEVVTKGLEEGIGEVTGSFLRKDRSPAIYQWSTVPLKDPQGKVIGLTGVGRDITERKRTEAKVSETAHRFQVIFNSINDGLAIMDRSLTVREVNDHRLEALGLKRNEVIGKKCYEVFQHRDKPCKICPVQPVFEKGEMVRLEKSAVLKDGSVKYFDVLGSPVFDDKGNIVQVVSSIRDITERKQNRKALQKSESQKRAILDGITTNIAFVNKNLEILWANKASAISVGKLPEEMIGHKCYEFWADPEKPCDGCPTLKAWKTRESEHTIMTAPDGRLWDERGEPVFDQNGELIGMVEIAHDITEQKQIEEALRESEEKFRDLANLLPQIVYEIDIYGNLTFVNKQAFSYFGYSQKDYEKGINVMQSLIPEDIDKAKENMQIILNGKKVVDSEYTALRKDGSTSPILIYSNAILKDNKPVGLRGVIIDISERKRLEEQLLQAQKMEAIGTLAGGMAHDFNNILTIIQGYTELALRGVREDEPQYRAMSEVRKASKRAANLTRQLLLFSRRQPMERIPLDLNGLIQDMTKMLDRIIGEDISLTSDLESDLRMIEGDPGTIEQVIMNLEVNARDAMPNGGEIILKTRNVRVDRKYCKKYGYARPGRFVCLSVRDTGVGMDQATMDRIFEPFFTTKGLGKGTGLGLSVVYGIVKQHEGWITVESAPEKGATFKVYVPEVTREPREARKTSLSPETFRGQAERIFVVEDDDSILNFSTEVLSESGYVVFGAGSVREALKLFEQEKRNFDLIFCDVVLPDGRGPELVERLLKRKPGISVLFTSGYSDERSDWHSIQEKGVPFLQKPYLVSDLLRAVSEAMKP